jgi:hypothetical protein
LVFLLVKNQLEGDEAAVFAVEPAAVPEETEVAAPEVVETELEAVPVDVLVAVEAADTDAAVTMLAEVIGYSLEAPLRINCG